MKVSTYISRYVRSTVECVCLYFLPFIYTAKLILNYILTYVCSQFRSQDIGIHTF